MKGDFDIITSLWAVAFGLSCIAWARIHMAQSFKNTNPRRALLTGCELARQVLDRANSNRIAVTSVQGPARGHLGFSLDALKLPEKVYYGNRPSDAAMALHEAAHQLQTAQSVVPFSVRAPGGWIFQALVTGAWILIGIGFLAPGGRGLERFGQTLFLAGFAVAAASLPEEKKVTRRALMDLTLAKDFGPEEKIRIKKILDAFRWFPFSEMIEASWHGLSKFKRIH